MKRQEKKKEKGEIGHIGTTRKRRRSFYGVSQEKVSEECGKRGGLTRKRSRNVQNIKDLSV